MTAPAPSEPRPGTWTSRLRPAAPQVRPPEVTTSPQDRQPCRPGPQSGRLAYSVDEAARLTGLSRDLLYDQMRRGNLARTSRSAGGG